MKSVDYIIVGFGIAGASISLQLRKRGRSVVIFDEPGNNKASRIAAGLFNPITGKMMLRTWNAAQLFPYLHQFYKEAENITGERFFHPTPICIPFASVEEQNNWMVKSEEVSFIEKIYTSSGYIDFINDPFGGVILNSCGYIDTNLFLDSTRKLFDLRTSFDHDKLIVDEHITYDDLKAKAIIFCEGTRVSGNPYFDWVPVKALKGETLQIRLEKEPPLIFNRGVYVVPSGNNEWRVGATYSHDTTPGVSEKGLQELTEKLGTLLATPYTINDHNWGIRPTTPDRRPILGSHPEHKNILIFNGLGTKGVSLAPWSSGVLCDYLEEGHQIKSDININRFYALYSKFRD